ncbi:MAG: hypothetical protein ACYCOU_02220 [Sulfobacillus sp.]
MGKKERPKDIVEFFMRAMGIEHIQQVVPDLSPTAGQLEVS